jgi:hypothetical protein
LVCSGYAHTAPDGGRPRQPVLFINGDWTTPEGGHWLPLERKAEVVEAMHFWLKAKEL